jgi:hypothetical protein
MEPSGIREVSIFETINHRIASRSLNNPALR